MNKTYYFQIERTTDYRDGFKLFSVVETSEGKVTKYLKGVFKTYAEATSAQAREARNR